MSKFSANFWGTDFCGTQGFDTLVKRLKDGKKTCTDIEEFLDKWAKAKEKYGKELIALAKQPYGKDEIGTLRKSWEQVKIETEAVGKLQVESSQKVVEDISKSLKEFHVQQKESRKKAEEIVRKAHQQKKKCYDRNNSCKSTYESKCKDLDKSEESLHKQQHNPQAKPQDVQKAEKKVASCKTAMEQSDQTYMDAVRALDDARQQWEREMTQLCQQYQELEEQRIAFLRHTLWQFTNYCSQNCVEIDRCQESVRGSLEECDVDADIDLFVQQKSTGGEKPAAIPYENYYNPKAELLGRAGSPSEASGVSHPDRSRPLPQIPPEEDPGVYSEVNDAARMSHLSRQLNADATYNEPVQRVVAIYDYEAQGKEELTLNDGDIITVLTKEDEVWWYGEIKGRRGMFPKAYVEVVGARV